MTPQVGAKLKWFEAHGIAVRSSYIDVDQVR